MAHAIAGTRAPPRDGTDQRPEPASGGSALTNSPPIQRFFAEIPAAADPFELLGVDPEACTDDAVHLALRRRLDRLGAHPHSRSPEADEVRLAMHVASALLLDPRVRAELIHDRGVARSPRDSAGAPPPRHADRRSHFEDAAVWAVASAGGWNSIAKRRLGALAHAYQVKPAEFARAVARVGQRAASDRASAPRVATSRRSTPAIRLIEDRARASRQREQRIRSLRRWGSLGFLVILIAANGVLMHRLLSYYSRMRHNAAAAADTADERSDRTEAPRIVIPAEPPPPAPSTAREADTPDQPDEPSPTLTLPIRPATTSPSGAIQRWASAAAVRLSERTAQPPTPVEHLVLALRCARLNLAAERLWIGDLPSADAAARSAEGDLALPPTPVLERFEDPAALTAPGVEGDGALALDLLSLRRKPAAGVEAFRFKRFTGLRLNPVDADVAAETALFGSPQDLRLVARRIVTDQAENPAMIHALLEALPRAGKQSATSSLIAEVTERTLPATDDPEWPVRARAALIERLAELLAPGLEPGVDALAQALSEALAASLTSPDAARNPIGPTLSTAGSTPMLADSTLTLNADSTGALPAAEALWNQWRHEASTMRTTRAFVDRLDRIERSANTRIRLARGPVQQTAACLTAVAEIMALVVAHERPTAASEADRLIADCLAERSAADHVFAQLHAVERARLRLWLLRFAVEKEGGS